VAGSLGIAGMFTIAAGVGFVAAVVVALAVLPPPAARDRLQQPRK